MKLRSQFFALLLIVSVAFCVQADEINYGDFAGDNVTFIDVTESSLEDLPLYGVPTVIGNMLDLPGTGFANETNNGEINFLDGRLTFMVEADAGTSFNSITIEEFGAYFTFGEESIASVFGTATVETLEGGIFSGTLGFTTFGSDVPEAGAWQESLIITFPFTTKITLTLDNQLFTFADDPGAAFISKQGVDITIGVPEPTTAALLAIGVIGFVSRRRR